MPEELLITLQIDGSHSKEQLRATYNNMYNDNSKILLIILGNGADNIETNACAAAGNFPSGRRALWIKSMELLTPDEKAKFSDSKSNNVVCSLSFSRKPGSYLTPEKAKFLDEIEECFAEAETRDEQ